MHTRIPQYKKIKISDIGIPDNVEVDSYFSYLVARQLKGKIDTAITRIEATRISEGSYVREGDKVRHISNFDKEYLNHFISRIRGGRRPIISVYWNPHAGTSGGYVCPDDEVAFAAYKALRIKYVPSMILSPKAKSDFIASVWIRFDGKNTTITRKVPSSRTHVALISDKSDNTREYMGSLMNKCDYVMSEIKRFHVETGDKLHYNFVLYRYVGQLRSIIDSIIKLKELNKIGHCAILVRSLYDLFLNFYLDWLSPEFFGPKIHFLSVVRMSGKADRESLCVLSSMEKLFENTKDKAFISPFGHALYENIYSRMSVDVHQSYSTIRSENREFSLDGDGFYEYSFDKIAEIVGVITTEFLVCSLNEIGLNLSDVDD